MKCMSYAFFIGTLAQTTAIDPTPDKSLAMWAIILLGVAVVLFFLEILVPSGGVIGILSATSLVAGIVMLFRIDTTLGLVSAIISLVAVPFLFGFALKLWPNTPIAKMLLLQGSSGDQPTDIDPATVKPKDGLIGVLGEAATDLRPVGMCLIHGRRHECLAENGLIKRGSQIRVVSVDGMGTKVRIEP